MLLWIKRSPKILLVNTVLKGKWFGSDTGCWRDINKGLGSKIIGLKLVSTSQCEFVIYLFNVYVFVAGYVYVH